MKTAIMPMPIGTRVVNPELIAVVIGATKADVISKSIQNLLYYKNF